MIVFFYCKDEVTILSDCRLNYNAEGSLQFLKGSAVSDKMHTEFIFELFPDSFSSSISFHVYLKTYLEKKTETQGRNSLVNSITCDLLESQLEGILVTESCSQCKRQKTSERSIRTSNLWFLYPLHKTPSLESCRKQESSSYPHLVYTHLRKLFVFIW